MSNGRNGEGAEFRIELVVSNLEGSESRSPILRGRNNRADGAPVQPCRKLWSSEKISIGILD